jgi:hypothetical protein
MGSLPLGLSTLGLLCGSGGGSPAFLRSAVPWHSMTRLAKPPTDVARHANLRFLGIHQHEQHPAGFLTMIDPRMIGRLLDHHIAGFYVGH